ncbi:MAG: substrate-binding domain-containing protein, partial [Bombilactobacillus sp.]
PKQIQIIGFDDIPAANVLTPKLTTIQQNTKKIAQTAVNSMMNAINKQNEKGSQFLIPTKLINRETTR